jgi:mannose-6-phosphate isomerase-like protein (cupin superfamily)
VNKEEIFQKTASMLKGANINIATVDKERPWGGFFVVADESAANFVELFFPTIEKTELNKGKISPKILLVEPQKKLSWQYHNRRAEIWKLVEGEAGIVRSNSNEQTPMQKMETGEIVRLQQGERHRLVGLDAWGTIAEIWLHTDPKNPSDEEDIIRVSDDFGR